jgi:hypothetical protein
MLGRRWCSPSLSLLALSCLPSINTQLADMQLANTPPPVFVELLVEPKPPYEPTSEWPCVPDDEYKLTPDDPTNVECPPTLGDERVGYFAGVSLYLPVGLDEQNFVEYKSGFVRNVNPVESVTCSEDLPGAIITYAAMVVLAADPSATTHSMRDELLKSFGYADMDFCSPVTDTPHVLEEVFSVPGTADKPEPATALFRLVVEKDVAVALVYEVHPNAWIVLHETLFASSRTLRVSGAP